MDNNDFLELKIKSIVSALEPLSAIDNEFDTCKVLYDLASISEWDKVEFKKINFLSKRLDISKKLFIAYFANGRKAVDRELTDKVWLELLIAVLLKAVLINQNDALVEIKLKRFNVLYKALDLIMPKWLSAESDLGIEMGLAWKVLLQNINNTPYNFKVTSPPSLVDDKSHDYKIIPLTILFYEGPIARAYLATIKSLGFKPQKIIELVAAKDVSTKKVVGKWLPNGFRLTYAASIQRNKIHYWPKQLLKINTDFVNSLLGEVETGFGFEKKTIDNANGLLSLTEYSDNVESILVDDLKDKGLQQYLLKEQRSAILYTGGGLVPETLLNIEHLKFLHIHPGFLPNIRGADCALWSSLLTGHTSATCFYMSLGIDTGDIIAPHWLPRLSFDFDTKNIERSTLYRGVYSFIDPWVRAFVLREIIKDNVDYMVIDSAPQAEVDGITFHFMHQQMRNAAFGRLFRLH